jgi:hypothetical protein
VKETDASVLRSAFSNYPYILAGACFACILQQGESKFWIGHFWASFFLSVGIPTAAGSGFLLAHWPQRIEGFFLWLSVVFGFITSILGIFFYLLSVNIMLGYGFIGGMLLFT